MTLLVPDREVSEKGYIPVYQLSYYIHSLYDAFGIMFSSTLQFIIVLVATAVLDIIQLGLYFDDDLGSSLSK